MQIQASINRILLKKIKSENQSGVIFLPDNSQEKSIKAQIVHIGEENSKFKFNINDVVYIPTWAGTVVHKDPDNIEYVVIKAEEILAIEK